MMKLQFQRRIGTIVAVFGKADRVLLLLRRGSARDLDFS
jgi:rRNA processing protein Gar1